MELDGLLELDSVRAADNVSEAPLVFFKNSTIPLFKLVQAINLYLIPVICGVGLAGGVCSFAVLTLTTFRYQPCAHYLAVLTVSDTGFLVALLIAWLTTLHPNLAATPGYCQVMVYMTYTCSFLSAWYLVLLMVDRYVTVCHPFHAPKLCTKQNARWAIGVVTVFSLLLYLHSFFTTDAIASSLESPCTQHDRYLGFLAIFTYVDFVATFALPCTAILVLNTRIILAVRNFRRRHQPLRQNMNTQSRGSAIVSVMSQAQVRATKMLVWVASVFLVLYLPSHAIRLYVLVRVQLEGPIYSDELMLAQQICQFFYYINFAVDFFVFTVTSKSFRRNIVRFLKKLRPGNH